MLDKARENDFFNVGDEKTKNERLTVVSLSRPASETMSRIAHCNVIFHFTNPHCGVFLPSYVRYCSTH